MEVLVIAIPDALQLRWLMENLPENSISSETKVHKTVKTKPGLRLELRGEGNYYKGILHIGSKFIPISDDILEELRTKTALSPDGFFRLFVEKVGYSSYLQEQIHQEVWNLGPWSPPRSGTGFLPAA